jgi:hypothetical protein
VTHFPKDKPMPDVSPLRLNLLRACYALLVLGLGITIWPAIVVGAADLPLMTGAVNALLGALGVLSIVGLFSPLRMLPLLVFEVTWKVIWVFSVALPLWLSGRWSPEAGAILFAVAWVVPFVFIIPWRHVWTQYRPTIESPR